MLLSVRVLFLSLFLLLAGAGLALVLAIDDEALVPGSGAMTGADLQQARRFLAAVDPRGMAAGNSAELELEERELELLLNYLLANLHGGNSDVGLGEGVARLRLTARLPDNPLGTFLNLRFSLVQQEALLTLQDLRVGNLPVPDFLADAMLQAAHRELGRRVPEYVAALSVLDAYQIGAAAVQVSYRWQPELFDRLASRGQGLLLGGDDGERLRAHAGELSRLTRQPGLPRSLPLPRLLGPMLDFARSRAGDPVEENRAALLLLSFYVLGVDLPLLLGETPVEAAPATRRLTLNGRQDFARHFLISAGLALGAGTGTAESIGLLKEMDDALEGGSGFSFTDLAVDRAGVRFAELAVADPDRARELQQLLASEPSEDFFIPDFRDLPEFLERDSFERQFGGVGYPAYEAVMEQIEQRISETPLFTALE